VLRNELGADVNLGNQNGSTPLFTTPLFMAAQNCHLAVLRYLVKELNADVNQAKNNGTTPLCIAAQNGLLAIVRCLVKELKADAKQGDKDGCTALYFAARAGNLDMVRCLVMECKADGGQVTREGTCARYIASQEVHLDVVQCLVDELGADVNRSRCNGSTLLMAASLREHRKVIAYLLKHGANPQAFLSVGGTAADVSRIVGAPANLIGKTHCFNPKCGGAGFRKCTGCKQARTGQRTRLPWCQFIGRR
jgi:ankyrin repeat protein